MRLRLSLKHPPETRANATDLRDVPKVAEEIGLVIVPHADGRPRAYVIEATRAVNEWIQKEVDSAKPLWKEVR